MRDRITGLASGSPASSPACVRRGLPSKRFEIPEWRVGVGVNIDYHVEFDGHYYSVPYTLVSKKVDVRATATTVECLYRGERVASLLRSYVRGRHTSVDAQRPQAHRQFTAWTPQRIIRWASRGGPETANAVDRVMQNRKHPELGFRAALGIIRLSSRFGNERVERACERARQLDSLGRTPPPPSPAFGSRLPRGHRLPESARLSSFGGEPWFASDMDRAGRCNHVFGRLQHAGGCAALHRPFVTTDSRWWRRSP